MMQHVAGQAEGIGTLQTLDNVGIRALILDDSVFDRRRIRRLTHDTQLQISLDEIASIDALDKILDQEKFDVVLIDYNLPQGDGLEALRRVQAHPVNGDCPAIMVTGDDKSAIAVQSLKMGCVDYLPKDRLTAISLRESIVKAIKDFDDARDVVPLLPAEVERLTSVMMQKYASALQPRLARIIRDMRTLKSKFGDPDTNLPGGLEQIERQCIHMWAILLDPKIDTDPKEFRH
jgi:CheY-like chemotaxis protein